MTDTPASQTTTTAAGHGAVSDIVSEWRQNWRTGIAVTIGVAVGISIYPAVSSLFVTPLQEQFGWTRGQIAFAQYGGLVSALAGPFWGRLIDHVGARRVMLAGTLVMASFYFALSMMNGPLWLYYVLYLGWSVTGTTTAGLTYSRAISAVFVKSRGFALAVSRSGVAVANALLPLLLFAVISEYGWRAGYATLGALLVLVAFPLVWFWIKGEAGARAQATSVTWRAAITNRRAIAIALGAGLGYGPLLALLTQLHPLLVGKGVDAGVAASNLGLLGLASLGGALVTGLLVDRFWPPLIGAVSLLLAISGCMLLLPGEISNETAAIAILLIGLGLGAELDLVAFLVARYCGVSSFSTVYGLTVFTTAAFNAPLATYVGSSYDQYGHYNYALMVMSASMALAAIAYLSLGRSPKQPD